MAAGDRVVCCLPKSIDAIAVMGGVLLAGATYVPIDPESPPERAAFMLRDAMARALVTDAAHVERLRLDEATAGTGTSVIVISGGMARAPDAVPDPAASMSDVVHVDPGDPSHILYTSGSTGMPKGVVLPHRANVAFVEWFSRKLGTGATDRFASHAPLHFAMSIFDVFMAQRNGGALVLIDATTAKDPLRLAPLIARERPTIWFSTPSILSALESYGHLERHDCSSLRFVLFAGEPFPVPRLRRLMRQWPSPRYFNLFGATETNVRFWHEAPRPLPDDLTGYLPIGHPLDHFDAMILDGDRVVAEGEAGELLLSGEGILSGYWNRPELNARAFHVDGSGRRWFRSGDVVVRDAGGTYHFRGRVDRMVKRHGYRIELAEVEAALAAHPEVAGSGSVAVLDESAGVRIVSFVTLKGAQAPSVIELKTFCAGVLPAWMIPDQFIVVASLPQTSTGKTDYQALAAQVANA